MRPQDQRCSLCVGLQEREGMVGGAAMEADAVEVVEVLALLEDAGAAMVPEEAGVGGHALALTQCAGQPLSGLHCRVA